MKAFFFLAALANASEFTLEQDPCAACDLGHSINYQKCALEHGNPCTMTGGQKKDVSCCLTKEKHSRCLECKGKNCDHGTCTVNKKYYSDFAK